SWSREEPQPPAADMVRAGDVLFNHQWQPHDPLCPNGDGLGPVYNATSCAACHHQAGVGGGGGLEHNVTTFVVPARMGMRPGVKEGVIHTYATADKYRETLTHLAPSLPAISRVDLEQVVSLPEPDGGVRGRAERSPTLDLPAGVRLS